jgi:ribosomal-protein-alanine N-acetyltransferase
MRKFSPRPSLDLVPIRQATPDDLPAIRKLEQQAETAAHWAEREYDALFAPEAPARIALLATGDADVPDIRGFVIARAACEEWEIENLVVAAPHRRSGVASALLRELLRTAAAGGAAWVLLEVRESNVAARQLYEKIGFSQAGRRAGYYRGPFEDGLQLKISVAVP